MKLLKDNPKKIINTALILMTFAAIGAAMVGFTHSKTKDAILYNEKLTLLRKLNTIIPAQQYDNKLLEDTIKIPADDLLGTNKAEIVYRARKQGKPVAVVIPAIAPGGYNGSIGMLVGIYYDGKIAGVRIVSQHETPGLGDQVDTAHSNWIKGFTGKSLKQPDERHWKVKRDGGAFDQFTGATISPRAVVKAVHAALIYYSKHKDKLFARKTSTRESTQ